MWLGAGKSCIAAEIAKLSTEKCNNVLVIAHRIELIEQLQDTFDWWGVPCDKCDIMMVQSMSKKIDNGKLKKSYDFIICDEAHHGTCKTYTKIFDAFPKAFRLLLTATPRRTNGQGLSDISDCMITSVSVRWLIENHFLAPFEYYAPKTLVDAEKLRVSKGDYEQSDTVEQLDKPKVYGNVISCYKKYAEGKQTIVFASSIQHSKKIVDAFRKAGYSAEHVDGKTQKHIRKQIMNDFRSGKIQILSNYEIISEGVSIDGCECCILLRPTKSLILFLQSSQRCMRYAPNKTAVILDMVGNFERHGLPDQEHEWSLEYSKSKSKEQSSAPARTCSKCFRTYSGSSRICPYCGNDNGKTKQEIEADEKAELERITQYEKKQKRMEVGRARTKEELEKIARERNYSKSWVFVQMKLKGLI